MEKTMWQRMNKGTVASRSRDEKRKALRVQGRGSAVKKVATKKARAKKKVMRKKVARQPLPDLRLIISRLPPEMWVEILLFLDGCEMGRFSFVNNKFRNLSQEEGLWRRRCEEELKMTSKLTVELSWKLSYLGAYLHHVLSPAARKAIRKEKKKAKSDTGVHYRETYPNGFAITRVKKSNSQSKSARYVYGVNINDDDVENRSENKWVLTHQDKLPWCIKFNVRGGSSHGKRSSYWCFIKYLTRQDEKIEKINIYEYNWGYRTKTSNVTNGDKFAKKIKKVFGIVVNDVDKMIQDMFKFIKPRT